MKKNKREKKSCIFLTITLILGLAITGVRVASPQSLPLVYVDPPTYTATSLGEVFTINISIANVSNLQVVKLKLGYNTTILDVTDVVEGPFMEEFGPTTSEIRIYEDLGYMMIDISFIVGGPAEGDGTLATATFNATYRGSVSCTLDLYDTILEDPDIQPINHEVADGYYEFIILYLTVTTGEPWYVPDEIVDIQGTLKQDGTFVDGLVAIEVRDPEGQLIVIRTLETGTNPPDENITIVDLYPCNSEGEPKTSFYRNLKAYFNITMKNDGTVPKNVTIALNNYDADTVPFLAGPADRLEVLPNTTVPIIMSLVIPDWVALGTGTVYASALTELPINGGAAYCPEKSATYEIVEIGGGGGAAALGAQEPNSNSLLVKNLADPLGSYSLNFRLLSSAMIEMGDYMVYAGSSYQGLYDNDNTTFSIKVWGDINGDGHVDVTDFTILGMNWYLTVPPAYPPADINEDGIVDVTDFTIIGMNWYKY